MSEYSRKYYVQFLASNGSDDLIESYRVIHTNHNLDTEVGIGKFIEDYESVNKIDIVIRWWRELD